LGITNRKELQMNSSKLVATHQAEAERFVPLTASHALDLLMGALWVVFLMI
jgi:hypothetical protein